MVERSGVLLSQGGIMELEAVKNDIGQVLYNESQIKKRVKALAKEISRDYEEKSLLMVGVLRGAATFLVDITREMSIPVEIDYIAVASYGSATKTSGVVRFLKDLDENIGNRHVLLVEDIVDTGLTLSYLLKNLKSRNPASLEVCTLLSKEGRKRRPLGIKYVGFSIPDEFVVGYGLDYAQKYRNLSCVCTLKPEVYNRV